MTDKTPLTDEETGQINAEAKRAYSSMFQKVGEATKTSSGCCDFICKLIFQFFATTWFLVVVVLAIALPVLMIIIGSYYVHDCTIQRYIPIYLIVGGVLGLTKNITVNIIRQCGENSKNKCISLLTFFNNLLTLFTLAWLITGSVWVYAAYEPEYEDKKSPDYCDMTLYLFSFWLITALNTCLCVLVIGLLALICAALLNIT